jgi:hypothetical protein
MALPRGNAAIMPKLVIRHAHVRKVVWPTMNEPPIGAIKPARQNEQGVGLSSKREAMLEVK